jgi:hypothetical protein
MVDESCVKMNATISPNYKTSFWREIDLQQYALSTTEPTRVGPSTDQIQAMM